MASSIPPSKWEHTCVILGVAEVRVPLQRLSHEEVAKRTIQCYELLLTGQDEPQKKQGVRCIGVVDSFYALQEVILRGVQNSPEEVAVVSLLSVQSQNEVILSFRLRDVISVLPAGTRQDRLIVVARTQCFGRTAIVLQLTTKEVAQEVLTNLTKEVDLRNKSNSPPRPLSGSWGKSVGRRLQTMLTSLGTPAGQERRKSENMIISDPHASIIIPSDDEDDDEEFPDEVDGNQCHPHLMPLKQQKLDPWEAEVKFLVNSEKSYIQSLNDLIQAKESLKDLLKLSDIDTLFNYVVELHTMHVDLLEDLQQPYVTAEVVAELFQKRLKTLRIYIQFIENIPKVDKLLNVNMCLLKNDFATVGESLRKPRMRLNHYILMIESMATKCLAHKALFDTVTTKLKQLMKEADTKLVLASVHGAPFDLSLGGNIVLTNILSLKKGEHLHRRQYVVLLQEKQLVLARGNMEQSEFVRRVGLEEVMLTNTMRGLYFHLVFHLPSANKNSTLLLFKARTIKLQQQWVSSLHKQIESCNKLSLEFNLTKCTSSINVSIKEIIPLLDVYNTYPKLLQFFSKSYNKADTICKSEYFNSELKLQLKIRSYCQSHSNDSSKLLIILNAIYDFHSKVFHFEKNNSLNQFSKCVYRNKDTFREVYKSFFSFRLMELTATDLEKNDLLNSVCNNFIMLYVICKQNAVEGNKGCQYYNICEIQENIINKSNYNTLFQYVENLDIKDEMRLWHEGQLALKENNEYVFYHTLLIDNELIHLVKKYNVFCVQKSVCITDKLTLTIKENNEIQLDCSSAMDDLTKGMAKGGLLLTGIAVGDSVKEELNLNTNLHTYRASNTHEFLQWISAIESMAMFYNKNLIQNKSTLKNDETASQKQKVNVSPQNKQQLDKLTKIALENEVENNDVESQKSSCANIISGQDSTGHSSLIKDKSVKYLETHF